MRTETNASEFTEWKPSPEALQQWGEECLGFAQLMDRGVLDRYFESTEGLEDEV